MADAGGNGGQDRSGFSVPEWARPGGASSGRQRRFTWRALFRRRRVFWAVVVLVVLIALWNSYPFVPNPWVALFRQPSGDASSTSGPDRWAMRGGNPQGTNGVLLAPSLQGIVERTVEVDRGVRSAPAVADGVVYLGGQSRILAIDMNTGETVWEGPASGPAHGVPAVARDILYFGTLNKRVIALDRATGRTLWEFEGDDPFPGTLAVEDGIVFAGSRGGTVHALDANTGAQLWTVGLDDAVVAPVAVDDGKLFAASNSGVLFIRNAGTGDTRARVRTGSALVAPPTAAHGRVYLISDGGILAFDSTVRELPGRYPADLVWAQLWIWGFPLPSPPEHSGLQWRVLPSGGMGAFLHTPAVTREALYLGTDEGALVALSPQDGGLLWSSDYGDPVVVPVLIAGDTLILAHQDGEITAIDRNTRQEQWSLSLGSVVAGPLAYAEGRLYAHTQDGRLHIIK